MVEIISENRASAGLQIKETYTAGVVLTGAETKACRLGLARLSGSYVRIISGEAFVLGMQIGRYLKAGRHSSQALDKAYKLLLNKAEIRRLSGLVSQKGMVAVPLKLYSKNNYLKLDIAVGNVLKKWQKKRKVVERQIDRETERTLKSI